MPIRVVEIHHHGIRTGDDEADLKANLDFYQGLLGLTPDDKRPAFPGIPGFWMNVGEVGQIHLMGGDQPSPFAKDTLKKAENATVRIVKPLILRDSESAAPNFSVFP
jgi:catechol 2,3-dioxygenase-like lactoylglutathione lyase family enzyme